MNNLREVTKDNIKSFLRTRKSTKFYFKFPFHPEGHKTLVVECEGFLKYSKGFLSSEGLKEVIYEDAWKAYKKYKK